MLSGIKDGSPSIRNKFYIFDFTFARVEKVWNTVDQRGIGNVGQMELHRMYHHDRAYPPSFGKWRTAIELNSNAEENYSKG